LILGDFSLVAGTDVLRADLADRSGGFSSKVGDTRNVLFVDPTGVGRWLVADNRHTVEEHPVLSPRDASSGKEPAAVAIAALVKPVDGNTDRGTLLLFDPPGRRVVSVAEEVRAVRGVALNSKQEVVLVYERGANYILAYFESSNLVKLREVPVSWPAPK
jgi:hypothetical protein